jgi:hypothetical protein
VRSHLRRPRVPTPELPNNAFNRALRQSVNSSQAANRSAAARAAALVPLPAGNND